MLAPDARWTIVGNSPISRTYQSRQEFLDQVITSAQRSVLEQADSDGSVRGIYADGDMVIVLFDGAGTARDGKPATKTGIDSWYLHMEGWADCGCGGVLRHHCVHRSSGREFRRAKYNKRHTAAQAELDIMQITGSATKQDTQRARLKSSWLNLAATPTIGRLACPGPLSMFHIIQLPDDIARRPAGNPRL